MWVWGGTSLANGGNVTLNTGGRYNPDCDTWTSLTLENAPPGRSLAAAVWTGNAALIFGGDTPGGVDHNSNFAWATGLVPGAPSIGTQPQDVSVKVGSNAVFSVVVTNGLPVTYQWKHDGNNIQGATSATLVLPNVQVADEGLYTVLVTNPGGHVLSDPARLTVLLPPMITIQPKSDTGYWGKSIVFSVTAKGSAPLNYLWYKDGFPIARGTNSTLELNPIELTDGGSYYVIVSNSVGSAKSDSALLVVNPAGVSLGLYAGLTIEGVVGKSYGIQMTTSVSPSTSWASVTNLTLTQPVQLWIDTSVDVHAPGLLKRYYRVIPIP